MDLRDFTLKPGAKPMRVVNKLDFVGQLERSVMEILRARIANLDGATTLEILRDLRYEFLAQVRHEGRPVRGMSKQEFLAELQRSRNQVLDDRDRANAELERLQTRLSELRDDGDGRSGIVPRGAAVRVAGHDLERRLRSLFDVSELAGRVSLADERAILAFAEQAVQGELDRRGVAPENDSEVALLERRIAKLTQSLASTEATIQKLARMKDIDPGVASEFRSVQGLASLDESFEQKKELLRDIFIANQQLRDALRG